MKKSILHLSVTIIWALPILMACLALAFAIPPGGESVAYVAMFNLVIVLPYGAVGALIISRHPRHAIGWTAWWISMATVVSLFGTSDGLVNGVSLPGPQVLWVFSEVTWIASVALGVTLLPLLFPTGGPPTRRWRWVVWTALIGMALIISSATVDVWLQSEHRGAVTSSEESSPIGLVVTLLIGLIMLVTAALASISSVVVRYQRSGGRERQQLKWFTLAAGICLLASLYQFLPTPLHTNTADVILPVVSISLPVAIAIAILRHNLYDIDRLINRTLVYTGVTGTLGLGFAGSILLFQLILSPFTGGNDLAIAASTLLAFALFRPLRDRLQRFVNRRFYRQKYDARMTLQKFGVAARDAVDLDQLTAELTGVISTTIQPAHVSTWLRAESAEKDQI